MAEWYTVYVEGNGVRSSFGAIGRPFVFIPWSPHGDPDRVLRCFPDVIPEKYNELRNDMLLYPDTTHEDAYDLVLKKAPDDEVEEDGWYLSGVGHHLLWCAPVLEEAVDVAQEHIAWDGRDPTELSLIPPLVAPHGGISHMLTDHNPTVWYDEDLWFGLFSVRGKYTTRRSEKR